MPILRALEVEASRATFGVRKHNLLQAMMAVEDISSIATPPNAELPPFLDVVSGWLDESKVRYTPNVSVRAAAATVTASSS